MLEIKIQRTEHHKKPPKPIPSSKDLLAPNYKPDAKQDPFSTLLTDLPDTNSAREPTVSQKLSSTYSAVHLASLRNHQLSGANLNLMKSSGPSATKFITSLNKIYSTAQLNGGRRSFLARSPSQGRTLINNLVSVGTTSIRQGVNKRRAFTIKTNKMSLMESLISESRIENFSQTLKIPEVSPLDNILTTKVELGSSSPKLVADDQSSDFDQCIYSSKAGPIESKDESTEDQNIVQIRPAYLRVLRTVRTNGVSLPTFNKCLTPLLISQSSMSYEICDRVDQGIQQETGNI